MSLQESSKPCHCQAASLFFIEMALRQLGQPLELMAMLIFADGLCKGTCDCCQILAFVSGLQKALRHHGHAGLTEITMVVRGHSQCTLPLSSSNICVFAGMPEDCDYSQHLCFSRAEDAKAAQPAVGADGECVSDGMHCSCISTVDTSTSVCVCTARLVAACPAHWSGAGCPSDCSSPIVEDRNT